MRWWLVPVLALVVPASGSLAGPGGQVDWWVQPGGDAYHSGAADWGQLDVQGRLRLAPDGFAAPTDGHAPLLVVATPDGLLSLGWDGFTLQGTCNLYRVQALPDAVPEQAAGPFPCDPTARLLAFDVPGNVAFWSATPREDGAVVIGWNLTTGAAQFGIAPEPEEGVPPEAPWGASVAALEGRFLNLALAPAVPTAIEPWRARLVESAGTSHDVLQIDVRDGRARWHASQEDFFGWPSFDQATAHGEGMVVEGPCVQGYCFAWLNGTGAFLGQSQSLRGLGTEAVAAFLAEFDNEAEALNAATLQPARSIHAAGDGTAVVMVQGGALVTIHPDVAQPSWRALTPAPPQGLVLAAPALRGHTIAAPLETGVAFVDARVAEPRLWPGDHSHRVQQVLLGDQEAAVLLAGGSNTTLAGASLHLVDVATARTTHRIALPLDVPYLGNHNDRHAGLTPLPDGRIVAWTRSHDAVLLGPPLGPLPDVRVADAYAPLPTGIEIEWTGRGERSVVSWGDGSDTIVAGPGGSARHTYLQPGAFTLRVTDVLPDGTTATTAVLVHPGEPRPQRLNLFQKAFSPERQETTFFILGLLVTVAAAASAAIHRRRTHSLMHAELGFLDGIAEDAKRDPVEARRDLDDYRRGLRARLASGRLRDAQYDILDRRVRDVASAIGKRR